MRRASSTRAARPAPVAPARAVPPAGTPGVVRRTCYHQHLLAAQQFADAARDAVARRGTHAPGEQERSLAAAAIVSAAAFLEGSITELFLDLLDRSHIAPAGRPHRHGARLERAWRLNHAAPTLEKYGLALSLADADPFHPRRQPWVDAQRLMHRRDLILRRMTVQHAARSNGNGRPHPAVPTPRLTTRIRLDAAVAQWAVDTAVSFSVEFCRRMGIPTRESVEPSVPPPLVNHRASGSVGRPAPPPPPVARAGGGPTGIGRVASNGKVRSTVDVSGGRGAS